jgi:hypothetical protein
VGETRFSFPEHKTTDDVTGYFVFTRHGRLFRKGRKSDRISGISTLIKSGLSRNNGCCKPSLKQLSSCFVSDKDHIQSSKDIIVDKVPKQNSQYRLRLTMDFA